MIRKMRFRFIRAAMLAVVLVLAVIMTAINLLNMRNVARDADRILAILSDNGGQFPAKSSDTDGSPDDSSSPPPKPEAEKNQTGDSSSGTAGGDPALSPETPYESRFFSVTLTSSGKVSSTDTGSIAAVNQTQAEKIALNVYKRNRKTGFYRIYRYCRSTDSKGNVTLIFLDCQKNLGNAKSFLFISAMVSLFGLAAVCVLVIVFSKKIVRPVEESYAKQKRFITDAGHELKTPLTIIEADISVLEMDAGENEWTRDVKAQTRRLAGLTGDLIYLARMDERDDPLQMIDFPLSDVVSETARSFRARMMLEHKNFSMNVEPLITCHGNEQAIRKLVSILLDNAVKYSDADGRISLTLTGKSKKTELTVSNTAASVDRETLDRMFDRFYKGDPSRNSAAGGYGLGLSIAMAIVSAHRGQISALSPDGKTMVVTVLLP